MKNSQVEQREEKNGKMSSIENQKKLIMQKIYESDIYKEFIQQWGDAETNSMVMEKVWIQKEL